MDDFEGWLAAFTQPTVVLELLVLALCVGLAWLAVVGLRKSLDRSERSIWFGRKDLDGVLFPLVLLCLGFAARVVVERYTHAAVLTLAIPVLVALVVLLEL